MDYWGHHVPPIRPDWGPFSELVCTRQVHLRRRQLRLSDWHMTLPGIWLLAHSLHRHLGYKGLSYGDAPPERTSAALLPNREGNRR